MRVSISSTSILAKCERAVSTLELAIVTPLLLLLIVGVVDFGLMLRKNEVLAAAARHGAFTASREIGMFTGAAGSIDCSRFRDNAPPVATISCQNLIDDRPSSAANSELIALLACEYLQSERLDLNDWEVIVSQRKKNETLEGQLVEFPFVQVKVSLVTGSSGCVMCTTWPLNTQWFGKEILWGEARYPLQGRCA